MNRSGNFRLLSLSMEGSALYVEKVLFQTVGI